MLAVRIRGTVGARSLNGAAIALRVRAWMAVIARRWLWQRAVMRMHRLGHRLHPRGPGGSQGVIRVTGGTEDRLPVHQAGAIERIVELEDVRLDGAGGDVALLAVGMALLAVKLVGYRGRHQRLGEDLAPRGIAHGDQRLLERVPGAVVAARQNRNSACL